MHILCMEMCQGYRKVYIGCDAPIRSTVRVKNSTLGVATTREGEHAKELVVPIVQWCILSVYRVYIWCKSHVHTCIYVDVGVYTYCKAYKVWNIILTHRHLRCLYMVEYNSNTSTFAVSVYGAFVQSWSVLRVI